MTNAKTRALSEYAPFREMDDIAQPLSYARKLKGLRWMFVADTASAIFTVFTIFGPIAPLFFFLLSDVS